MSTITKPKATGVIRTNGRTLLLGSEHLLYFEKVTFDTTSGLPTDPAEFTSGAKEVLKFNPDNGEIVLKDSSDSTPNGMFSKGDLIKLTFDDGELDVNSEKSNSDLTGYYVITSYDKSNRKITVERQGTGFKKTRRGEQVYSTKNPKVSKVVFTNELLELTELTVPSTKYTTQEAPRINDRKADKFPAGEEFEQLKFTMYVNYDDKNFVMIDKLTEPNAQESRQQYAYKILRNNVIAYYGVVTLADKNYGEVSPNDPLKQSYSFDVQQQWKIEL